MLNSRRGSSPVITSVVLTGIMLSILYISLFISDSIIEYHAQATEYENAKRLLIYTADAIEQIALGSGGAKYVRFNLRTTRLDFVRDYKDKIVVKVNDIEVLHDKPDALMVKGGSLLSSASLRVLYPEGVVDYTSELKRYVVMAGEPITLVYETFDKGAVTILTCKRVRISYLGIYSILVNGTLKRYSSFEISYINMTMGVTSGSSTISVVIRNIGLSLREYYINGSEVTITVYVNGEVSFQNVYSADNEVNGVLVLVKVANIEVSTLG